MWESRGNFLTSLLSGTCIFPIIAVPTTPTAMYRKTVFGNYTQNSKTFLNLLYKGILKMDVTISTHL
jgi:hypothetical protein